MSQVQDPCRFCGKKGLVWYRTRAGQWVAVQPNEDGTPNPRRVHKFECKSAPGSRGTRSFKPSEYRLKRRR
jgi:hypothetical protein